MVGIAFKGGLAQLVRASALHAEGRRFDSDSLHISVVVGGREIDFHTRGWSACGCLSGEHTYYGHTAVSVYTCCSGL